MSRINLPNLSRISTLSRQKSQITAFSGLFAIVCLAMAAFMVPSLAQAQSAGQEMTVEELEAFLEKRKKELETVIANRESMLQKQAEIREQLKAQQSKAVEFEKQFLDACEEINLADPDNPIDCEKELEDSK